MYMFLYMYMYISRRKSLGLFERHWLVCSRNIVCTSLRCDVGSELDSAVDGAESSSADTLENRLILDHDTLQQLSAGCL